MESFSISSNECINLDLVRKIVIQKKMGSKRYRVAFFFGQCDYTTTDWTDIETARRIIKSIENRA